MSSMTFAGARVRQTDQCSKYHHPEIEFEAENVAVPETDLLWMKATLEGMVARGSQFKAGETLQMGAMILRFEAADGGKLRLLEPDMKGMPIHYVRGVSQTLRMTRGLMDTADSYGLKGEQQMFSILDVIGVPADLSKVEVRRLRRDAPEGRMSGWFYMDARDPSPDLRPMSIYEFALNRPELVKFLSLPVGSDVVVTPDGEIMVYRDEKPLKAQPGSFIDLLNQRAAGSRSPSN